MKRILASYVIVITVLLSSVGVFGMPRGAAAQLVVTDPITGAQTTIKNVWDYLLRILGGGAAVAVLNAVGYFTQKLAYDAAVYIAAGGSGQGPLFEYRNVGDYLQDTLQSAAGEGIGTLNELGFAGFNLCDPTGFGAPQFKIRVLLGLGAQFASPQGPRPKCEWNNISANWEQFSRTVSSGEVLRRASVAFEPGESQLGVAAQSSLKLGELAAQKANQALEDLKIGEGFKSLTHPISGQVKTPSQVVQQEAKSISERAQRQQEQNVAIVGPALAQGALSVLPAALGTFVNTLSSKLLQQLFKKGLFDLGTLACKAGSNLDICRGKLQNPEFAGRGGEAAARAAFADFITPAIQSQQSYDALTEFSVCPDQFRSPSNCVMDERFAAVVRQARVDRAVTVRDAIAQGYLHGDWPLVAATGADQGKNQDPYCFASGYCFGNLQKLRKARIIPIGWELAAAKAQNGRPTLREVMNGFNDCPTPESPNPADHPNCRLIDPDWVLLYPASQCRARVYGPTLVSGESDLRAQTCVDAPSCIAEDEKGNCIADYGYCTREKTVWQLGGDSCPAQYATCTSYQGRTGGGISVLTNTVDYGVCSSENVGCRGFSRSQDPGDGVGDWTLSDRVFLSAQAARCEVRDAGCSEVLLMPDGRTTSTTASFLKLPPAYLGCTGEASDPPECASYAHICRPSERGCELYTPTDGTPAVPGTVAEGNRCPAACIGYTTYRQEESAFDFAAYPLHFIASSARQCTARAAGCTEFTNLDTLEGGGEAREYYSELRACRKSDDAAARIFYTWEGSEAAGFQLKEWRLIAGADDGPALMAGADPGSCTRDIFRLPAASPRANPDCREFYNTDGVVFYRLYSKTIVATDDCHPYRITTLPADPGGRAPADACAAKDGEWRAAERECVFLGYPAESRSCAAAENGCRLYVGNAGRNVRDIFFDDFEGGDRSGWGPERDTAVSTESVFQGQHSLRVNRDASVAAKTVRITEGGTYFLNFWAKGRGAVTVRFASAPRADRYFADRTVELRENWNLYTLGPVNVDWPIGADEQLAFTSSDGRRFADIIYLDKIQLRQVTGTTALIKDSWRTPAICDQTAEGAIVPQAQLNCRAYRDRAGRTLSVTGFDSICRAEAVGCTALTETQESANPAAETWNALCVGTPGPCLIDGVERCTIPSGRQSCRYRIEGTSPGIACGSPADGIPLVRRADGTCAASDEVVVPADRVTFAVNDQRMSCTPDKAGCEAVGLPRSGVCRIDGRADRPTPCPVAPGAPTLCTVQTGEQSCRYPLPAREPYPPGTALEYETTVVKNDPRTYNRSLCTIDAVGCESWQAASGGAVAYFKQPDDRLCEYREQVPSPGGSRSGWFKKGTDEACDPDFVVGGNFNGIRRNGDPEYAGFVGQCPAQHNSCTEFVDPTDRVADLYPNGRPYYYLKNDKLDTTSCNGQVSPKAGCVLFQDSSNPARSWNASSTYAASVRANNTAIPAVSDPPNDSNVIVKVKQSRQCGEWLACQSSTSVWDARENRFKEICDQIGLCNAYSATEPGRCQSWVTGRQPEILTEDVYRTRDTSFAGMEYSGYSIPLNFPTESLSQVVVGTSTLRLARVLGDCGRDARDGEACTVGGERGACWSKKCAQAIRGSGDPAGFGLPEPLRPLGETSNAVAPSCRAYPEQNAPFPSEVKGRPGFQNAKVCEDGQVCECAYQKVTYGAGSFVKYFSFSPEVPSGQGFCQGGTFDGKPCNPRARGARDEEDNLTCTTSSGEADDIDPNPGTCQIPSRKDPVRGLEGYCLESDTAVSLNGNPDTRACLTWLPTDRLAGSPDIYNQYASAGFPIAGSYLCVEPKLTKTIRVGKNKCSEVNEEVGCGGGDEIFDDLLDDSGIEEIRCAPGYFVAVTRCYDPGRFSCGDGKVAYRCVPIGSVDESTGKSCDPRGDDRLEQITDDNHGRGEDDWEGIWKSRRSKIPLYFIKPAEAEAIQELLNHYDRCVLRGVPYNERYFPQEDATYEFSCATAVQVAEADPASQAPNKAWTNRVWSNGTYVLDPRGAPPASIQCDLGADCAPPGGRGTCPCSNGGVEICRVNPGERTCTGPVNLLTYVAATPPSFPPLRTFGQNLFEDNDPVEDDAPVSIPQCVLNADHARKILPIPASDQCFSGYTQDSDVMGRPYLAIATERLAGIDCDDHVDCNVGVQCENESCYRACRDNADCPAAEDGVCTRGRCTAAIPGVRDEDACRGRGAWYGSCRGGAFDGQRCERDSTCWSNECDEDAIGVGVCVAREGGSTTPLQVTGSSEVSGPRSSISDALATTGIGRIQQIFARSFEAWKWVPPEILGETNLQRPIPDTRPGFYEEFDSSILESDVAGDNGDPPTVRAIGSICDEGGRCTEGETNAITVNNQSRLSVIGGGGSKFVTLKFYGYADDDQMPIRHVLIDWGDESGPLIPTPGSYKNHRGYKPGGGGAIIGPSECDGTTFGRITGACESNPFVYTHSYSCPRDARASRPACGSPGPDGRPLTTNCWNGSACVFVPRVQLKDNWGFCNGSCGDAGSPGRQFCYDGEAEGLFNECSLDLIRSRDLNHWTTFAGQVLVSPP